MLEPVLNVGEIAASCNPPYLSVANLVAAHRSGTVQISPATAVVWRQHMLYALEMALLELVKRASQREVTFENILEEAQILLLERKTLELEDQMATVMDPEQAAEISVRQVEFVMQESHVIRSRLAVVCEHQCLPSRAWSQVHQQLSSVLGGLVATGDDSLVHLLSLFEDDYKLTDDPQVVMKQRPPAADERWDELRQTIDVLRSKLEDVGGNGDSAVAGAGGAVRVQRMESVE